MRNYRQIAQTLRECRTIAEAAERLGMTPKAVAMVAHRLRKRYPQSFPKRKPGRPAIDLGGEDAPDQGRP